MPHKTKHNKNKYNTMSKSTYTSTTNSSGKYHLDIWYFTPSGSFHNVGTRLAKSTDPGAPSTGFYTTNLPSSFNITNPSGTTICISNLNLQSSDPSTLLSLSPESYTIVFASCPENKCTAKKFTYSTVTNNLSPKVTTNYGGTGGASYPKIPYLQFNAVYGPPNLPQQVTNIVSEGKAIVLCRYHFNFDSSAF